LNTAPTPVVTAQPTSAALSSGIFGSILTTFSDGDGGVLGHHAAAGEDAERLAGPVLGARRSFERCHQRLVLLEAQHRTPRGAEAALAAHVNERADDVIACSNCGDAFPDLDHGARGLVAENQRRRQRDRAVGRGQIRMTDTARGHLHHHLAALGRIDRDLLYDDGLIELAADHRLGWTRHLLLRKRERREV
jgi:hypothetical protein